MDSKIPLHEIYGSIYYKFETYNGLTDFQYQVLDFYLFFIHTVGSISKYEIEIMVSYSITRIPFLYAK